ncbi:MAG: GAF domain-containing protein, partial [Chloroflexi bacterium]|nr:GAF domain-containing protein [Chloroflexota bacterium]
MRIKKPNVPSGQDNSPGDKPTMRDAITRILREAKDSLAEHPILSVVVLLIMALLSAVELLDSVALEHPTAYSRPLLVIDQIDDLIAVGVALFVAYRWRPRLGQLAAIFYLALHVPYVFFDLPDETYEMARQGFMGFTTLLGVWLIDKLRKTQIILETAEQTFRTTVNSTPAGVCIAQDGKLSYVNPQFAGHTGYSEEELIGADFLELVAADDRRLVRNNAREAVQKGLPSSCEHRFVTKGGETRWVLQTAAPITYNGKTALIGSFVDITRRRQAEADVRRQEQRREALYRVSQAVTRSLALRDVANLALDAAIDILRVDAGIIRCFDEAEQRLVLLAHRGLPAEAVQDIEAKPGPKSSHGASGLILESETLVVIEDITARPDLFYGPVRRAGFVTFAGFPLKVNDRAIGTMSAFFTSRRSFAPDDVEMLSSLGNIIGVAVANAQLFEGQRLRNQELAALQRVSQAVAASLDLEKVAGQALAEGLAILNLDGGFIRYVDEAREETVMLATLGIPSEISKEVGVVLGRRKLTEGLVGQVVQTGLPMIVDDYARRSRHPFLARAGFQCAMFLPLKVGNKVVGTLTGFSAQPRSFSAADTDMMTSIGNMVGMAIDNARFLAKMKDRSEKRAAMNSITAAIASSLHIDEIYAVIAREISHVIPYDRLTVGILTPEKDAISILQIGQAQQMPQRQSLEDTPLGEVAKTGEPCIYRDLELEASVYPVVKHLVEAGFHSGLVAPLSAEGNVLGTLNIVSREVGRYSQADLEYVQPIAHQLAVALSHARLFGQVEAAAKEWGLTFDAIGDGVMILSPDLRILQANSAMGRLTGTSPDAIVGQHCFRVVHGLMEPTPECPSVRCKELRQPCELVIQDPHPGNRWFNVRCEPMLAPDGRLTGIVHTLQDITARKQAEDDLRKAHNELEERIRERTAELTNVNEVLHAE